MPENPYDIVIDQELRDNRASFQYVIMTNDPGPGDHGQYVFEPASFQNQFPGRITDDSDQDLYTVLPSTFGVHDGTGTGARSGFAPYQYKIRRDITRWRNRKIYVSNIAMTIGDHKYARVDWRLAYFDDKCHAGWTDYDFDEMVDTIGNTNNSTNTPFDRRGAFIDACNDELCNPPYRINARSKEELWNCMDSDCDWNTSGTSTVSSYESPEDQNYYKQNCNSFANQHGIIGSMHWYTDGLNGEGSDNWDGKWTIGNHFGSHSETEDYFNDSWWDIEYDTLMSPANTPFKGFWENWHAATSHGGDNPYTISGSDSYVHGAEWEKTMFFPIESPINVRPGARHDGTTTIDGDFVVSGLEGSVGIKDLFSTEYSIDEPSISGNWYVCVHQNADGWEWNVDSWEIGWREKSRERRWQCFKVPKKNYIEYWFDLTDDYVLGKAGGSSNNPTNYKYEDHLGNDRTYIKHYEKNVSWMSNEASWTSMTNLDTYMAVGIIPPTMGDLERIGPFSKYSRKYMGWINPTAPHVDNDGRFRFYNPFKYNNTEMHDYLDLTGVRKADGKPLRAVTHVRRLQKFQPIIKTTVSNGLLELQRYYDEGVDNGFELTSAPAELEFSVDIMSNKAFFPSDSWTLDGVTFSLFELKQTYGVEFKYFVADWGDGDINVGGTSGGFVDEYQSFPTNVSEWVEASNLNTFIVFNHDEIQRHTYYEEGIYTITSFVMCLKQRVNDGQLEEQVLGMKKVETKIRIQKEFIFYPDYLHLGSGDYPIIPWTSGTAPIISGISDKSDYKDSLRKILSSSTFLFSDSREAYVKGNTRSAYINDELGEFLGKSDIDQIRVFLGSFDMNYMLGLNRISHISDTLQITTGDCSNLNNFGEIQPINDKIYGTEEDIPFFLTLHGGQEIKLENFVEDSNNKIVIVNGVDISNKSNPYISVRSCEALLSEGLQDSGKTITNMNPYFIDNSPLSFFYNEGEFVCDGYEQYSNMCVELNQPCGLDEDGDGITDGTCVFDKIFYHDYHHYDDKNYWTGVDIDHSFSSESSVNSIFINGLKYRILKDGCILEYNFEDNDGITIRDSSGNQNNGIIIGDYGLLKVAEDVPMGLGSSIKKPRIDNLDEDGAT